MTPDFNQAELALEELKRAFRSLTYASPEARHEKYGRICFALDMFTESLGIQQRTGK